MLLDRQFLPMLRQRTLLIQGSAWPLKLSSLLATRLASQTVLRVRDRPHLRLV